MLVPPHKLVSVKSFGVDSFPFFCLNRKLQHSSLKSKELRTSDTQDLKTVLHPDNSKSSGNKSNLFSVPF